MTVARKDDERWMALAIKQAQTAELGGEVPVGALVVRDGQIIAHGENNVVRRKDPTAHAEIIALREAAAQIGDVRLTGCTLYVTLEPCAMCAGAIVLARPDRLVFGAWDLKAGMVGSIEDIVRHPNLNHRPEVLGGVMEQKCGELLRAFFAARR